MRKVKNEIMESVPASYVSVMRLGATLLMSGFYEEDVPSIR